MPLIPTRTIDFKSGNSWGVLDGPCETEISQPHLLHAAITAGHRGMRGLRLVFSQDDWPFEIDLKASLFHAAVKAADVAHHNGLRSVSRLVPRASQDMREPTGKGTLSYALGMTMATAWVRAKLKVPWLLHLDVYWDAFNMPPPQGERPDLIGRHADGRWVAIEAKGFRNKPSRQQQSDAKDQAKRIVSIGGVKPDLNLATITFFADAAGASARPKPKVLNLWAVDPEPSKGQPEPIKLEKLTPSAFFKLYYKQWDFLFRPGLTLTAEGQFLWLGRPGMGFGVLPEVLNAVKEGEYEVIPKLIARVAEKGSLAERYPGWVGDGIVLGAALAEI